MCTYIRKLYMAASTWTMSHYGHSGTGTETVSYRNSGVISKPFFIFCATLCIHLCHTVTHTQTHINKYYWAIEVKCACLAALDLMYSRFVDTYACNVQLYIISNHHLIPPSIPTIILSPSIPMCLRIVTHLATSKISNYYLVSPIKMKENDDKVLKVASYDYV